MLKYADYQIYFLVIQNLPDLQKNLKETLKENNKLKRFTFFIYLTIHPPINFEVLFIVNIIVLCRLDIHDTDIIYIALFLFYKIYVSLKNIINQKKIWFCENKNKYMNKQINTVLIMLYILSFWKYLKHIKILDKLCRNKTSLKHF